MHMATMAGRGGKPRHLHLYMLFGIAAALVGFTFFTYSRSFVVPPPQNPGRGCVQPTVKAHVKAKASLDAAENNTATTTVSQSHLGTNNAPRNASRPLNSACAFFFNETKFEDQCDPRRAARAAAQAAASGGCLPSASESRELLFHMWTTNIPWREPERLQWIMLTIQAWAISQDLRRSRLVLWTSAADVDAYEGDCKVLQDVGDYVSLRTFSYEEQIVGTPLEVSAHFRNYSEMVEHIKPTQMSDIVRNLLLHNFGGVWLDTDSVPLEDLWNITNGVGLYFMPKFNGTGLSNVNILYVPRPRSALARRRLDHMTLFPNKFPESWPRQQRGPSNTWVYNNLLSEHTREYQAKLYNLPSNGSSIPDPAAIPAEAWDNLEVTYPIEWFDPWWGCGKVFRKDFSNRIYCRHFLVWHRLNKQQPEAIQEELGMPLLWDEIRRVFEKGYPVHPQQLGAFNACEL